MRKVSLDDDGNRFRHAQQKIRRRREEGLCKIMNVSRYRYA